MFKMPFNLKISDGITIDVSERLYSLLFSSNEFIKQRIDSLIKMVNSRIDEVLNKFDKYFKELSGKLDKLELDKK